MKIKSGHGNAVSLRRAPRGMVKNVFLCVPCGLCGKAFEIDILLRKACFRGV